LNPEAHWTVTAFDDRIEAVDPKGEVHAVAFADLSGVMIETNDTGPIGTDVWWLLFGADSRLACTFPQGADGEEEAVARLIGLPGFDREAMILALASTTNAVFPVWRAAP
jgi:hypothetical protein